MIEPWHAANGGILAPGISKIKRNKSCGVVRMKQVGEYFVKETLK
jgi:hypothetical protein